MSVMSIPTKYGFTYAVDAPLLERNCGPLDDERAVDDRDEDECAVESREIDLGVGRLEDGRIGSAQTREGVRCGRAAGEHSQYPKLRSQGCR